MLDTSKEFKEKIKSNNRQVVSKVEVFFEDVPAVFYDDDIISIELVEEARADDNNPLGLVSANEVTISFDNSNRDFTPTNVDGLYSRFMRPNILIKPYLGVVLDDESIEYIPLGMFTGKDWDTLSDSTEATVTGLDKMFDLAEMEIPMIPVIYDTDAMSMFKILLMSLGVPEDDILFVGLKNLPIRNGWFKADTVISELQNLCRYSLCNCYIDRYGKVVVQANDKYAETLTTYTDDDMLITTQNPQRFFDAFSQVKVNYSINYIKDSNSILDISGLQVDKGEFILENIMFSDSPCIQITQISVIGAVNVNIKEYGYGANSMYLIIENLGESETVDIKVEGKVLGGQLSSKSNSNLDAINRYGLMELQQTNHLMQDREIADNYSKILLGYVSDPLLNYSIDYRGDPSLELFDAIKIINNTNRIGEANIVPYRHTLSYDGTLSGKVEGRKL